LPGKPRRYTRPSGLRRRRKPLSIGTRLILASVVSIAALLAWAAIARSLAPSSNTHLTRFDAIIVLGTPADSDGNPRPNQLARVTEAVREYQRGVAPRLILTGGAAHNRFVEAHVMSQFAISQGVPASDLLEEGHAQNTIQNIFYSAQIMHAHNWSSAEVVSSGYHLGRAGLILATFNRRQPALALAWRTHPAARAPEYFLLRQPVLYSVEATRCLYYRLFGFPESHFLPRP